LMEWWIDGEECPRPPHATLQYSNTPFLHSAIGGAGGSCNLTKPD